MTTREEQFNSLTPTARRVGGSSHAPTPGRTHQASGASSNIEQLLEGSAEPLALVDPQFTVVASSPQWQVEPPRHYIEELEERERRVRAIEQGLLARQAELKRLAYFDDVTGLPNRRHFEERLRETLAAAHRHGDNIALLHLRIQEFQQVSEGLGRSGSEQLLKTTASRLAEAVRPEDFVAHLGGDDFLLSLPRFENTNALASRATEIVRSITQQVSLSGQSVELHATVGIALYPNDVPSASDGSAALDLRHAAELALTNAVDERAEIGFFNPDLAERAIRQMYLTQELYRAIDRNEFTVHYQTIHDTDTLHIAGMEALVRWNHAELGSVAPDVFIPLAEEVSRVTDIDRQVLDQVLQLLTDNRAAWPRDSYVTVNWSAHDFKDDYLVDYLERALAEQAIPAKWIAVELTESIVLSSEAGRSRLRRLEKLGVRSFLDDFGTGYSALEYVSKLPLSTLKVDRSFTNELGAGTFSEAIISSLVTMSDQVGLETVIEGVENQDQLDHLRDLGAGFVQGYLLCRPAPADDVLPRILLKADHPSTEA